MKEVQSEMVSRRSNPVNFASIGSNQILGGSPSTGPLPKASYISDNPIGGSGNNSRFDYVAQH